MVDFTYEDLYELLRTEKFSTDLQSLKETDIKKIADYLTIKQTLLEKQTQSKEFFNQRNVDKIRTEIDNAKRILKDVFEIRERKIINRAIFTSRSESNIRDSTNMLRIEEDIYNQLIALLQNNSKKFFDQLTTLSKPKELKIEQIRIAELANKIYHISSTETKEIKTNKRMAMTEGLAYIESYIDETGFELFNVDPNGVLFILVKK